MKNVKVIGFDADDTLWENEMFFRNTEKAFYELLEGYEVPHRLSQELYQTEIENLQVYGYGIKGFVLSMIETAIRVTDSRLSAGLISRIIDLGRAMLSAPVHLLPDVPETLAQLGQKYRLILVTKGDLLEQQRKLRESNLEGHFHHIEILSKKGQDQYQKLLDHLDIQPGQFVMVGNSLKSDILPPISIGCQAVHIPFHTTWVHEQVPDHERDQADYLELAYIRELLDHF